jgi:hypothetical protein
MLLPGGRPTDAGDWHNGRCGEFVPRRPRPGHPIPVRHVRCPERTLPIRRQPRAPGRALALSWHSSRPLHFLLSPHGPLRLQWYCALRSDDTDAFFASLAIQSRGESPLRSGGPPHPVRPELSTNPHCANADLDESAGSLRSCISPSSPASFDTQSHTVSNARPVARKPVGQGKNRGRYCPCDPNVGSMLLPYDFYPSGGRPTL